MMLQQDEPKDYVFATGETITMRDFAKHAFKGEGFEEVGIDKSTGKVAIRVDRSLFRPTRGRSIQGY